MTRNEFNAFFAATMNSTDGYSETDLDEINEAVFADVSDLDLDDDLTDSRVKNTFAREFDARS